MIRNSSLIIFTTLALATILIPETLYQQQHLTYALTITSTQRQTDDHGQSSTCINGVCTDHVCTDDSCQTSIRCVNGRCETTTSSPSITSKSP